MRFDPQAQLRILKRRAAEVIAEEELLKKLKTGRPLRVKLGIDPSAPHITLGHSVPMKKLRQFQDLGHQAVLIVGDFTRRIGDPSERTTTRPPISEEEIKQYMQTYQEQAFKILDPKRTEIRYNSEWLSKLSLKDIIRLTATYTVARMLEREDFSKRFAQEAPITMMEFLYPLVQAYDSVAIKADVELGGLDQKFNFAITRDIQREYGQDPEVIVLMPLLLGTDGKHVMSQSRGNYIGIAEPSFEMFGKLMSIPDEAVPQYVELLTELNWAKIKKLHAKSQKQRLAWELVKTYHGEEAADAAQEEFERIFTRKERPKEPPKVFVDQKLVKADGTIWIIDLIEQTGLVKSRSEARRLIEQGAVELDGQKISSVDYDLKFKAGLLLKVGKKSFVEVHLKEEA